MDPDAIRDYLDRLLAALEGIETELAGLEIPAAPEPASPDPAPLIATIVLAVVAALVAAGALVVAWRALGILTRMREEGVRAGRSAGRVEFARGLRRYSDLLGIEAVAGRAPVRGETAAGARSALERRLGADRDTGALELLEEVADSRAGLADLPRDARTAANGLAAMSVEWSIDRWIEDPEGWMRDHRERRRLRALAHRPATDEEEPVDGDTRLTP